MDVLARLSEDELKLVRYLIKHSDRNGVAVLDVKGASSELGISEKKLRKLASETPIFHLDLRITSAHFIAELYAMSPPAPLPLHVSLAK